MKNKLSPWQIEIQRIKRKKITTPVFLNTTLTPEDADILLENQRHNRKVSDRIMRLYAKAMKAGEWVLNGETLKISSSGRLEDGGHRLHALKKAGIPVQFSLALNIPVNSITTIDTGRRRTAGDLLSMNGYKNCNNNAAVARQMLIYQTSHKLLTSSSSFSSTEVLNAMKRWPHIAYYVGSSSKFKKLISPSIIQFTMYVLYGANESKALIFFHRLLTGENLNEKSPILMLRNYFLKHRLSFSTIDKRYTVAAIFQAWNAFIKNKQIKNAAWDGVDFPEVDVDYKKLFAKNYEGDNLSELDV